MKNTQWKRQARGCAVRLTWTVGLALVAGCGGGGDGGDDGNEAGGNYTSVTLEQACSTSCEAQAATNCPGVYSPAQCTDFCLTMVDQFPGCSDAWRNINACMAESPLFCDQVNGGAAVSSDDCGPEIDALATCM